MRTVGVIQSVFAGLAFLAFGFLILTSLGKLEVLGIAVIVASVIGLFFTGVYFRQALMLQSAAEHLAEVRSDPDDAHPRPRDARRLIMHATNPPIHDPYRDAESAASFAFTSEEGALLIECGRWMALAGAVGCIDVVVSLWTQVSAER
jgi:hypothetical protein